MPGRKEEDVSSDEGESVWHLQLTIGYFGDRLGVGFKATSVQAVNKTAESRGATRGLD